MKVSWGWLKHEALIKKMRIINVLINDDKPIEIGELSKAISARTNV